MKANQMKWRDWIKLYEDPTELTERRKVLGLTQAELAQAARVERTWLVMVEQGKINISDDKIKPRTEEKLTRVWQVLDAVRKQREKQLSRMGTLADLLPPKNPDEYVKWKNRMSKMT